MKKLLVLLIIFFGFTVQAQLHMDQTHGDMANHVRGMHDGNQIRCHFGNDGMFGRRGSAGEAAQSGQIPGEWPVNSAHYYMSKIVMLPMAETRDIYGNIQHVVSECHGTGTTHTYGWQGSVGDLDVDGRWRTMCPLPGFIGSDFAISDSAHPALSDAPYSWPERWPDMMNDPLDPGWPGMWNGYFGKGQIEADQESYYVTDDYQNDEYDLQPDANDPTRAGLGLRMFYRGLQWANPLVQDVLYIIYDVENVGTTTLDKVNFAVLPGIECGDTKDGWDGTPDSLLFEIDEDWFIRYDLDDFGKNNFTPVARVAYALYESPGNEFDGIDNDNDGSMGSGGIITEALFEPFTIGYTTPIVITDYNSYERTVTTMKEWEASHPEDFVGDTLVVEFIGRQKKFWPGIEVKEEPFNNFDDNLNGVVDESNGALIGQSEETMEMRYVYVGNKYINYFSGDGLDNLMLDESRKDGIDNDGDWVPADDVGVDGMQDTYDYGEKDGMPTSKYQGGVALDGRGEPHIDATDITESDMLGMTAFGPNPGDWQEYGLQDDEKLWDVTIPGNLVRARERIENPFMGSGYFPLPSRHIERFSGAFMFGNTFDAIRRTKRNAGVAYENNYQFYRAPNRPTLTAVAGDRRVVLFWDALAEDSKDPILGKDFEGYRIYRSTGERFDDMVQITNAFGDPKFMAPMVQFDLVNDIQGLSTGAIEGVQFYLGEDTGLRHSWVDTTVKNGFRYFYLITSYDHGDDAQAIPPTECNYKLLLDAVTGEIQKLSENIAIATPNPPSIGYVNADVGEITLVEGATDSKVSYVVTHPSHVLDGHIYQISFQDSLLEIERELYRTTAGFTLFDSTDGRVLLQDYPLGDAGEELPTTDGFQLSFENEPLLTLDTLRTGWSRASIYSDVEILTFEYSRNDVYGMPNAADYLIEFGEAGVDTSTFAENLDRNPFPAVAVNFRIFNITEGKYIDFAFEEDDANPGEEGMFTFGTEGRRRSDRIIFLEKVKSDSLVPTWEFSFARSNKVENGENPVAGDFIEIYTHKPFLSGTVLRFKTVGEKIDVELARNQMEKIKVVPNPYIVTNSWEKPNPYTSGRGPRELHFTHLPAKCTIRIFDVAGQLVDVIERDGAMNDGTLVWDMLTKDEMEIGFGVYVYHVDAGEIGEKIGKFAVIK